MADGLLVTRSERLRLFWTKLAAAFTPPGALGVVTLVLGGGSVGWMILIVGALLALFVVTSARTVRGAGIAGAVVAVVLFLFQLLVAHIASHPIE
jgi:hypothetical protein